MTSQWPSRVAAILAVVVGLFLVLGGVGHLIAILKTRAGQPFDYRFVSLVTTSGILIFPGLVGIVTSFWLWRGRTWAYASCLVSGSALMLYLVLLICMKAQVPDAATEAGDEVYFMSGLVVAYIAVTLGALLRLQRRRTREP
jgi:hypothetical protein